MNAAQLARPLAFFSLGLGLAELIAGRALGRSLGVPPALVRGYGAREIATGLAILAAPGSSVPLWGRVAGDALDAVTLIPSMRVAGHTQRNAMIALGAVLGVAVLDLLAARARSRR